VRQFQFNKTQKNRYDPDQGSVVLKKVKIKLDFFLVLLPNYQLSIFCQILQILFEYMHPNVLEDQVSNRIDDEWRFEIENG